MPAGDAAKAASAVTSSLERPRVSCVRAAVPGDAAPLAAFAERTFREAFTEGNTARNMDAYCNASYSPEVQAAEIADPHMRTIVCEDDAGALVGYAQLRLRDTTPSVPTGQPARIQRIYVDAAWHGTGVARKLMEELMAIARAAGADRIWLGVWEHNPRAQAFYRKFGFDVVGDHAFRFGDEAQTDLVMSRSL